MSDAIRELERIKAFLADDPPDVVQALSVVKAVLLHEPCLAEIDPFRRSAQCILANMYRPLFVGDRESAAVLKRLLDRIQRDSTWDAEGIDQLVVASVEGFRLAVLSRRSLKQAAALESAVVSAAFKRFVRGPLPEKWFSAEKKFLTWEEMHSFLGWFIAEEGKNQRMRARETDRKKAFLQKLVAGLAAGFARMNRQSKCDASMVEDTSSLENLPVFVEVVLREAADLQNAIDEGLVKIWQSQEAVQALEALFRKTDEAILDVQDDELVDAFTQLPNRFALSGRLSLCGSGEVLSVLFVTIADIKRVQREIGRKHTARIIQIIAKGAKILGYGDRYRVSEETLVWLLVETETAKTLKIARHIKHKVLDKMMSMVGFPAYIRFGIGLVQYELGMDEARLLSQGSQVVDQSLAKGGEPVAAVVPA